jgi:hypothetical protein
MAKLNLKLSASSDETGVISATSVTSLDASEYPDETQALKAARGFMEKNGFTRLWVGYGLSGVELDVKDDLAKKADELFYESKVFDLNNVKNWNAPEWNVGDATRAASSKDAAASALRISAKFGKKVAWSFNRFAGPAVEQTGPVTEAAIDAANKAYVSAWQAKYAPMDLKS